MFQGNVLFSEGDRVGEIVIRQFQGESCNRSYGRNSVMIPT